MSKEKEMLGYRIFVKGKVTETVYFSEDCTTGMIYRTLVDSDNYPPHIEIRRIPSEDIKDCNNPSNV